MTDKPHCSGQMTVSAAIWIHCLQREITAVVLFSVAATRSSGPDILKWSNTTEMCRLRGGDEEIQSER